MEGSKKSDLKAAAREQWREREAGDRWGKADRASAGDAEPGSSHPLALSSAPLPLVLPLLEPRVPAQKSSPVAQEYQPAPSGGEGGACQPLGPCGDTLIPA